MDPKVQLLKGWDNAAKDVLQKGAACEIQAFLLSCALIWISGDQLACSAMVTCLLWDTE